MSTFTTQISYDSQVKPALDAVWGRLQEISGLIDQVDHETLDKEDQSELAAISRITAGYAQLVIEAGAAIGTDQALPLEAIGEIIAMVNSHCDDSFTALTHVVKLQAGVKHPHAIRVY